MSETKSVADLLGEFLIALAGTDRAEQAEAEIRLRAALPVPLVGAIGPDIRGLTQQAQLLRYAELGLSTAPSAGRAVRVADRRAYRAARLAIEERLEMIFEAAVRSEGVGALKPARAWGGPAPEWAVAGHLVTIAAADAEMDERGILHRLHAGPRGSAVLSLPLSKRKIATIPDENRCFDGAELWEAICAERVAAGRMGEDHG